jgi:4-amino-4-deoxy-L-arabinose transferase-like glycosyltransferase
MNRLQRIHELLQKLANSWLWILAVTGLGIVALIPRLALAHSLDLTTDEGVYIPIGLQDVHLLSQGAIYSPHWLDNAEAPALPKLFMGLGAAVGQWLGGQSGLLFGARLPGVLLSVVSLVLAVILARPIVGALAAWLGGLVWALSPWLAYFAALAYLDTYMLAFLVLGVLCTWHAARHPRLVPLVGVLLGLALASKYTALAALIPIVAYLWQRQRSGALSLPRRTIGGAVLASLLTLYLADPAIWVNPVIRLGGSVAFQVLHASNGHNVFWFGQTWRHVIPGIGLLIVLAKMSLFITLPALAVVVVTVVRSVRHRAWPNDTAVFLLCWFIGLAVPFSGLSIIVGTHYVLPLAPAIAMIGGWGLVQSVRWLASRLRACGERGDMPLQPIRRWGEIPLVPTLFAVWLVLLLVPPIVGHVTIHQAEGYTSEWLRGEDAALQVAYPAYADALDWLTRHTQGTKTVALIALPYTLDYWMMYHQHDFPARFTLVVGTPDHLPQADYLIWPKHLMQRKFAHPPNFHSRLLTSIKGGDTTYCYILI